VDVAVDVGTVAITDGVAGEEGAGVKVAVAHAFVKQTQSSLFVFGVGILSIGVA